MDHSFDLWTICLKIKQVLLRKMVSGTNITVNDLGLMDKNREKQAAESLYSNNIKLGDEATLRVLCLLFTYHGHNLQQIKWKL